MGIQTAYNKIVYLIFLVLIGSQSNGQINLQTAGFTHKAKDKLIFSVNSTFELERSYQSRSLFQGLFGFGWCSELDRKIASINSAELVISHCGKKEEYKFLTTANKYLRIGMENNYIVEKNTKYLYYSKGQLKYSFSGYGKLEKIFSSKGDLQLSYYKSGELSFIKSDKVVLRASTQSRRITKLGSVLYEYDGELLEKVSTGGKTLVYSYDYMNNLKKIFRDGDLIESVNYDKDKDRVSYHRDKNLCENWYQFSEHENGSDHTVEHSKKCGAGELESSQYSFYYKLKKGLRYLASTKYQEGKDIQVSITYHESFGRPLLIKAPGTQIEYKYDSFGRILKKTENSQVTVYDYKEGLLIGTREIS